jgi:hypothetical protein
MDEKEANQIICNAFKDIESHLIVEALDHYYKKEYSKFWRDIDFLNDFLTTKGKLVCDHSHHHEP